MTTPNTSSRGAQQGVVLVIALVGLVVLMIGGVALVRSMGTSTFMAGNLAFKRDLVNQGERAMAQAISALRNGALAAEGARQANLASGNYSAQMLKVDAHGVPELLVDNAKFGASGMSAADITDASAGVTIRYVIDRQCSAAGAFDADKCMVGVGAEDKGGSNFLKKPAGESKPVYRISVRVSGPRGTQAYLQTTATL